MVLCTQSDVETKLQTSGLDASTVTALIEDAQAEIEAFIGRTVESASRTETLDGSHRVLLLKYWPVTAVSSVSEDGTTLTVDDDYKFYENGMLVRVSNGYPTVWKTRKTQAVSVSYTGGFKTPDHDSELDHLGNICAEVAARGFRKGADAAAIPAGAAGQVQSISLEGSDSVTYATGGGAATTAGGLSQFVYLTEDEQHRLAGYQTPPFV